MTRRLALTASALLIGPTTAAVACDCVARSDAAYRAQADAVFTGIARSASAPPDGRTISSADPIRWTFAVQAVAKGRLGDTAIVTTARLSASCGTEWRVGRRDLVYASVRGDVLQSGLCSGGRELAMDDPRPFALRRVAVYGTYAGHLQGYPLVGDVRGGEHPGRAGIRLLLDRGVIGGDGTQIPRGTRLVRYSASDGLVRIVLSRDVLATSRRVRRLALAQIVWTATDLPGALRVRVSSDAGAIAGFDRPLTRRDFADLAPAPG